MIDTTLRENIRDACEGLKSWPLLITGGIGVGKTRAALCLADAVIGHNSQRVVREERILGPMLCMRCGEKPASYDGYCGLCYEAFVDKSAPPPERVGHYPVFYWTVSELVDAHLQAGRGEYFRGSNRRSFDGFWQDVRLATLVILDELGTRSSNDLQYEVVKRLIDAREDKPAVFISNISLAELAANYDARIASRVGCGTVCEFSDASSDRRMA